LYYKIPQVWYILFKNITTDKSPNLSLTQLYIYGIADEVYICILHKTAMNCPKCTSDKKVKSGIIKGIQRYKCKACGCNYTVELKSTAKPQSMKKQALHLYLEGLGFRSIGRILGVSNVSILNWIRSFGMARDITKSCSTCASIVHGATVLHSSMYRCGIINHFQFPCF
jgi:transposase-like protein